ncbi:hypothetical protein C7B62_06240 [Pleurocapsa sp. CCALA 161]|uniref:hypothetical protein n=1 Tax=Pleurocapsa sp. CCALA 161 TaxID=2107688 RepID=UPI000D0496B3|nr:hypothetical protein [Pleurocapsa sp. CCALA 161]PSB11258.1 hypothetical protein C7B62_06240 [Pleurocapsa sp. CCALA 161]
MLTKIVDLTQLCVVKQVQYILVELEKDRDNLILQDSYYQQQLIEYVLSNLNHRFMMLELTEIPQDPSDVFPQCPIDEQIAIRQLLQMKISQIGRYVGDGKHDSLEMQSQKMKNTFTSKNDSRQRKREVQCEEDIRPCLIQPLRGKRASRLGRKPRVNS